MGRPRGFDEDQVVQAAVELFAGRGYDGTSVDDLVAHLGVHRNSLYKTFGSKRGLYLAALRWHLEHQVRPLVADIAHASDLAEALHHAVATEAAGPGFDLLLMAAAERAPVDPEVAAEVTQALRDFDEAVARVLGNGDAGAGDTPRTQALTVGLTAAVLGLRLRTRAGAPETQAIEAGTAVAGRLNQHKS